MQRQCGLVKRPLMTWSVCVLVLGHQAAACKLRGMPQGLACGGGVVHEAVLRQSSPTDCEGTAADL